METENELKAVTTNQTDNDAGQKKKKDKKTLAIKIINIVTGVVIMLALVFTIEALYARKNSHNNYFGYAVLPVQSDSMKLEGGAKDNFERGDLIFVKILKADKKRELNVGDVITFKWFDMSDGELKLNTHRIISKDGTGFITQGDAVVNGVKSMERVDFDDVVGVFKSKMAGIGHIGLFFESSAGMFVVIVVPFFLLLALSVFYFIRNFRAYSKERTAEVAETTIVQEKERLRQEILAELEKENNKKGGQNRDDDKSV